MDTCSAKTCECQVENPAIFSYGQLKEYKNTDK